MTRPDNIMLHVYLFIAVLAAGECNLAPMLRPILSMFASQSKATSPLSSRPRPELQRFQDSPAFSGVDTNRWEARMETAPMPMVTPMQGLSGGVAKNLPQLNIRPVTEDKTVFKSIRPKPQMDQISLSDAFSIGHEINKVNMKPVKNTKLRFVSNGNVKPTLTVTPVLGVSMLKNKPVGDKWTVDSIGAMESKPKYFWKNVLVDGSADSSEQPEHDSDDQPDTNMAGVRNYWSSSWDNQFGSGVDSVENMMSIKIKGVQPGENDKMRRIFIVRKPGKPVASHRFRTYLHSKDLESNQRVTHSLGWPRPVLSSESLEW